MTSYEIPGYFSTKDAGGNKMDIPTINGVLYLEIAQKAIAEAMRLEQLGKTKDADIHIGRAIQILSEFNSTMRV